MGTKRTEYIKIAILLCVLVPLVHHAVFTHPFILDERHIIENNDEIKDWRHIPAFFVGSWKISRLYRPLVHTTLAIDYAFWQLNPLGYRITSCCWHILLSFLVFAVLRQIWLPVDVCHYATCLYALHPIHSEVLNCTSLRGDTICACFCLLTWLCYRRDKNWLALVFLGLSCLAKETGVAMLLVLFLDEFCLREKSNWRKLLAPFVVVLLYLALRSYALGGFGENRDAFADIAFWDKMRTMSLAFVVYIRLCICPVYLGFDYQLNDFPLLSSFADGRAILGVSVVTGYLIAWLVCIKKQREVAFWLGWFGIFLLPVSNIVPTAIVMGERFLTLPLIAFAVALAAAMQRLGRIRQLCYFTLILVPLCMLTFHRNNFWQDEERFYQRMLQLSNNSYIAHMRLGGIYYRQRDLITALQYYKKAVEQRSYRYNRPLAPLNCARIYDALGNRQQQIRYLEIARERIETGGWQEKYREVYFRLGTLYWAEGQRQRARECFDEAQKWGFAMPEDYTNRDK